MFITESLFTSQLNLTWKNKKYQFANGEISLSLFEREKKISQFSENNLLGNIKINFLNFIRSHKENLYRDEIWNEGKNIATVIVIYSPFKDKLPLMNKFKNMNH